MSYEVDFWPHHRNAVEISSSRDYIGEIDKDEQETIYLNIDDFFRMVEEYSEAELLREAWNTLKNKADDETKNLMSKIEFSADFNDINFRDKE